MFSGGFDVSRGAFCEGGNLYRIFEFFHFSARVSINFFKREEKSLIAI